MPSVREGEGGAIAHYDQIKHESNDHSFTAERQFFWQDAQQPATSGQAHFGSYSEINYSATQPPLYRAPEELSTSDQNTWSYGAHQGLLPLQNSSTQQYQNTSNLSHSQPGSFCLNSSVQQPILPLPAHQRSLGTGSTVNAMDEAFISNSQMLQPYPYDVASRTNPATFSSCPERIPACEPEIQPIYGEFCNDMPVDGCETDDRSKEKDPSYAKLIYQALMEAPGHKMILRDIYTWIAQNTDKARDPLSRGWQNSIRHNLSMNGVNSVYCIALDRLC